MKKQMAGLVIALLAFFSLGLSLFVQIYLQSSAFTIIEHSYKLKILSFFLSTVMFFILLFLAWKIWVKARDGKLGETFRIHQLETCSPMCAMLPLCFFFLSPLLLAHYMTRSDLKTRLNLLALFILLAILYLVVARLNRISSRVPSLIEKGVQKFSLLTLRKKLLILFLVSLFIYQGATFILVSEGITFSGDEPNYLLTSHSLLKDGDINLANNYKNQDYFAFYSRKNNPRLKMGIYGRYGRKGKDYIYPINLPGISVLMLPFYWLSQSFSGKMLTFILKGSLTLWAALLGLQLYLFALERWKRERLSLLLWFLYSFTTPVFFYATHLYPEIVIAFFSLLIFRKISSGSPLSRTGLLLLGFCLGTFPWLGLKYNFIFWALLLVSVYYLWHVHKVRQAASILAFLFVPVVSMVLFYSFVYDLYGTLSPFSVYEGVMTSDRMQALTQAVLQIPLVERIDAFLDYFLDQRDGLLLYSPFYFFTLVGLVEMFRRARRDFWALLFISLPFLLNYAFFTHRQGYCPQARVLMPISWVGAIAIGTFMIYNSKKIFTFLFQFMGCLSLVISVLLLRHPSFLYQPTTHEFTSRPGDLFVHLSNLRLFLPPFLPSFIKIRNIEYWPNYVWLLLLIGFVLIYVFWKSDISLRPAFHFLLVFVILLGSFFLWVLYPRTVAYPAKTIFYSPQRSLGFYLYPMGRGVVAKESGDFYLHFEKSYKFLFGSKSKLKKIKLLFGSQKGEYDLDMHLFDLPLFSGRTAYETKEMTVQPAACYPLKTLFLYEVNLTLKHHSPEPMLIEPYFFQVIPLKD